MQVKSKYVVQLEEGVFIAAWSGDPGRTVDLNNAQLFDKKAYAEAALLVARGYRPFKEAKILHHGPRGVK